MRYRSVKRVKRAECVCVLFFGAKYAHMKKERELTLVMERLCLCVGECVLLVAGLVAGMRAAGDSCPALRRVSSQLRVIFASLSSTSSTETNETSYERQVSRLLGSSDLGDLYTSCGLDMPHVIRTFRANVLDDSEEEQSGRTDSRLEW